MMSSFWCHIHGGGRAASGKEPNQVVEVRLRHLRHQICGSSSAEVVREILEATITPNQTPMASVVIPLPLGKERGEVDPVLIQKYVVQKLMSTVDIGAGYCEIIASFVAETVAGDRETKFHIVADVDIIEAQVVEAMEKNEEELGECCICLEELNCEEKEVIEIPCGHVYHDSCIYRWLINDTSCPLCRSPCQLED